VDENKEVYNFLASAARSTALASEARRRIIHQVVLKITHFRRLDH
jgi:aconitase A